MHEMHTPPDGLRVVEEAKSWRGRVTGIAMVLLVAHLLLEYSFNFLPVTYPLLTPKLGLTYGQIGTLVLVMTIAGTITQPLFGLLSDRGDPRRIVVLSIIWGGVLMGLVGFMPSYNALFVLLVLAALGSAAFHPPAAALASHVPLTERGQAMSLFSVGGNLGAALSPFLVGIGLTLLGLSGTALIIPVALVTGVAMYFSLRSHPDLARHIPQADLSARAGGSRMGSLAALLAIVAVVGSRSFFQQAVMTYLPQWLQQEGWTLPRAGAALAGFMVAVSTGSLFGGAASDRFGRLRIILVGLLLMSVGLYGMLHSGGAPQIAAIGLAGLAIGISFPVTIVLAQEAYPHRLAFASAMVMGLGWLPAGLGAWTVGQIADRTSLTDGLTSLLLVPLAGVAAVGVYYMVAGRGRGR